MVCPIVAVVADATDIVTAEVEIETKFKSFLPKTESTEEITNENRGSKRSNKRNGPFWAL